MTDQRFEDWWARNSARVALSPAAKEVARGAVPAGWVLVPVDPTVDQSRAGWEELPSNFKQPFDHGLIKARAVYNAMLTAAPAAPEKADWSHPIGLTLLNAAAAAQQEPDIRDAVKRSCPLCEESWYEFAEGAVAQALNAQQATPSCESKTVDSESQPSLSARGSQQEQSELPPGWKTVVVPEEVGPEPDWEDVRYQAETATGIELPRAVFSIVIREVRRWLAAQQTEAQPVAWINYPVICDTAGNFAGYGRAELSFTRVAYGFDINKSQPLYTAQPKAVPLTEAQAAAMASYFNVPVDYVHSVYNQVNGIVAPAGEDTK